MADEALLEPGSRSRTEAVNGVRLHWIEAGPADGPVVILLHGFPEYWWGWRRQIAPLAETGHRVVAPDMRGYNESDTPSGVAAYRADVLATDVVRLADALGAPRFALVGHDWGGIVAWEVAGRYPERVERLAILNAPHPDTMAASILAHPSQALKSSYIAFFQLPFVPELALRADGFAALRRSMKDSARPGTFGEAELDRYAAAWAKPRRLTAMLDYYRALRFRRSGAAARIAPPTLVLWGERDSFLESHLARAALGRCDRGRLVTLPDATHWLHHEEPERVGAELAAFLAES